MTPRLIDMINKYPKATRMSNISVIGDDAVSLSIIRHLNRAKTVMFIGRDGEFPTCVEEHTQNVLEISKIPDFIEEIDTIPDSAVVATSQDNQNLLFVQYLSIEFDMKEIVVRVNIPQNIEAYADLSVALMDTTDIVGAALAQQLEQSDSNP